MKTPNTLMLLSKCSLAVALFLGNPTGIYAQQPTPQTPPRIHNKIIVIDGKFITPDPIYPVYPVVGEIVALNETPSSQGQVVGPALADINFSRWSTLKASAATSKGPVWLQATLSYGDVLISERAVIYNTSWESRPLTRVERKSLAKALETEIQKGSKFQDKLEIAVSLLQQIDPAN